MAANPDVLVSVEEYLHTSCDPDCDYVDGHVEERNVGEGPHSQLQWVLCGYLYVMADRLNIRAWPEQRVRVSPTKYLVPDICVTSGRGPVTRILEEPPLICIEILSSEDRLSRVLRRAGDYLSIGVPHIWIFDSLDRVGYTFSASGLKLSEDGVFSAPEISLSVDLAERFAEIER